MRSVPSQVFSESFTPVTDGALSFSTATPSKCFLFLLLSLPYEFHVRWISLYSKLARQYIPPTALLLYFPKR
jgi:hypothetical protein